MPLRICINKKPPIFAVLDFAELLGSRIHEGIIFHVHFKRGKRDAPRGWYQNYFVFRSTFFVLFNHAKITLGHSLRNLSWKHIISSRISKGRKSQK